MSLNFFNTTLQRSNQFLLEIADSCDGLYIDQAYTVFVTIMHTLRDSLPPEHAVFLGSNLTPLLRGIYYDQWAIDRLEPVPPPGICLQQVTKKLHARQINIEAKRVLQVVLQIYLKDLRDEQVNKVYMILPPEICELIKNK